MKTSLKAKPEEKQAEEYASSLEEQPPETQEVARTFIGAGALIENEAAMTGDFDRRDVRIPSLKIVPKDGALADAGFTRGSFVYSDALQLTAGPEKPLTVRIVKLLKFYNENLLFGSPEMPRQFASLTEVFAAGGTAEWVNNVRPTFSPAARVLLLVEKPVELDDDMFPLEFVPSASEGLPVSRHLLAAMLLANTAYRGTVPNINSSVTFTLKPVATKMGDGVEPLHCGVFEFTTEEMENRSNPGKKWFGPKARIIGTNSAGFVKWMKSVLP